ncbi:MAG: zinc metalloprotease [Pseudoxanthomonas sp.]
MPHHFHLAATDPAYARRRLRIEGLALVARRAPRDRPTQGAVVVHIVSVDAASDIDDAQVRSQLDVLNEDFRFHNGDRERIPAPFRDQAGDALVEFSLAHLDPSGQPTSGITRMRSDAHFAWSAADPSATRKLDNLLKSAPTGAPAWPREDYLNVWVAPLEGGLLGYAQFPGGPAATDGVVIRSDAFGRVGTVQPPFHRGRTCTHEVGHWLNLLHIWGDDGNGCQNSDNVGDTPNQGGANYGTPDFPHLSCGNGPDGDMFMNYMDYVDDEAMQMFSRGQIERMDAALAGPRASLASSAGLEPPAAPSTPSAAARDAGIFTLVPPQRRFNGIDWR